MALPAHNVLAYIETMLATVNAQTYPCGAYIFDDASDDGLGEFLAVRPTWYRAYDRGARRAGWAVTLNRAVSMALADGCDAVLVGASDDFLRLDCVEQMVRLLHRVDFVLPYAQQIGGENVVQVSAPHVLLADMYVHPPMVNYGLYRADVWRAAGGYATDVTLPGSWGFKEDWDFHIRLLKAGYRHAVVAEPVYYYRMRPGQLHEDGVDRLDEARALIMAKHPGVEAAYRERMQMEEQWLEQQVR